MAAQGRVWRLSWFGRVVAAVFVVVLAAWAIAWLVVPDPLWVHLLAAVPAALTIIPWRFASCKVVLTAEAVVIRNVFEVRHVPLTQVRSVTNRGSRGAVVIRTADGERIWITAVHPSEVAWALGRRTRANEMMEAIEDAALARGAQIPTSRLRRGIGSSPRPSDP